MKTTKKDVDKVYSKPIDPAKPFERLTTLMQWAISELQETKEKKIQSEATNLHYALSIFYPENEVQSNPKLCAALEVILDDLFSKCIPEMENDPLYIPKI